MLFLLLFHLIEQGVESLEAGLPNLAVAFQPSVGFRQRLGFDAAQMSAPHHAAAHELGTLQDPDVLGGRGKRHAQRRRQFAEIPLSLGQTSQHRPPRRMRQCMKDPIECGVFIFNHVVYYNGSAAIVNHLV